MKISKAIIPAAGLGTRLYPATKAQPKEMLPIYDTPLIQFVVEEAYQSGIKDICIITGKGKRAIEDHFDLANNNGSEKLNALYELVSKVNIFYTRQPEPKGLGDAILQAEAFVGNEPFAILLGDDFYTDCNIPATQQLINKYNSYNDNIALLGVEVLPPEKITEKGMVIINEKNEVSKLIEKPALKNVTSKYAISGRYILPPEIFSHLKGLSPGHGGEIHLTDGLVGLLDSQYQMYVEEIKGTRVDFGRPMTYLKANIQYALAHQDNEGELNSFIKKLVLNKDSNSLQ